MLSRRFWYDTLERAVRTFAQTLGGLIGVGAAGLLDVDWPGALSASGLAALISFLMSIGSSKVGNDESASLVPAVVAPMPDCEDGQGGQGGQGEVVFVLLAAVVVVFLAVALAWCGQPHR